MLSFDHESEEFDDDECVQCLELHCESQSESDWIHCRVCKGWLHKNCTLYSDVCPLCWRNERRKEKKGTLMQDILAHMYCMYVLFSKNFILS